MFAASLSTRHFQRVGEKRNVTAKLACLEVDEASTPETDPPFSKGKLLIALTHVRLFKLQVVLSDTEVLE